VRFAASLHGNFGYARHFVLVFWLQVLAPGDFCIRATLFREKRRLTRFFSFTFARVSRSHRTANPMKTNNTLAIALVGLAAALTTHAQSVTNNGGLLGQRYAEASVGLIDPHGISSNGFSGDLAVNLPVQTGLDANFSYSYDRFNTSFAGTSLRSRDHTLGASLVGYNSFGNLKPFFGAGLGYQWNRTKIGAFKTRDDDSLWALGTGVEIPCGTFTLTPKVTYQDGFKSDSAAGFTYGAEAHTWFTKSVGGFADVTFSDPTGGGTQAWVYRIGARMRF
jgi:opacity protein-like surface antigen